MEQSLNILYIFIAIIPIPLFYLIYVRTFVTYKPSYIKHIESFLYGVALALLLVLVKPYIISFTATIPPGLKKSLIKGFFEAALLEKIGAFLLIYIVDRYYPHFSVTASIGSAILLGIGFSLVENIFYAMEFGFSIIFVRLIVSVPLHITTCGILGYYFGQYKLSETPIARFQYAARALLIPILLHGLFDSLLFMGGTAAYFICPMLLSIVIILEFFSARAYNIYEKDILEAMEIRFEDWLSIDRQPRYDRWILASTGNPNIVKVPFFRWDITKVRGFLIVIFLFAAFFLLPYKNEIMNFLRISIKEEEAIVILGIYPACISFILFLVGAINPKFLESSIIRIPIISDVEMTGINQIPETVVTYSISPVNCFLKTSELLGINTEISMVFECPAFTSPPVQGKIVWENLSNRQEPLGSIAKIVNPPIGYYRFLLKYYLFRFKKGLAFNMKLPGFELTRKFFMRPITTMQKVKFFKAGTTIFHEGDPGRTFFFIKKGKVVFHKKKGDSDELIVMDTMEDGEIFGEMAVTSDHPRAASAICVTDCILAVADKDNLHALIVNNPDFASSLIGKLSTRVNMSEKILSKQISTLKRETEYIFHFAVHMSLSALKSSSRNKDFESGLTAQKMAQLFEKFDEDTILSIITSVISEYDNPEEGEDLFGMKLYESLEQFLLKNKR